MREPREPGRPFETCGVLEAVAGSLLLVLAGVSRTIRRNCWLFIIADVLRASTKGGDPVFELHLPKTLAMCSFDNVLESPVVQHFERQGVIIESMGTLH